MTSESNGEILETLVVGFQGLRVQDLTHTMEPGMPVFPSHAKYFQMPWVQMDDPAEMNQVIFSEHTGTHVDSPSHFVLDPDDSRRVHIDKVPLDRFMGRAIRMTFGPFAPSSHVITEEVIRAWEREHTEIRAGDIVLIDFSWGKSRWKPVPDGFAHMRGWPGLAHDAAVYLVNQGVKAVGTDCISLDSGDGAGGTFPAHRELLPRGILIYENLANLDLIADVAYFVALPLRMSGGTGSPVRAVAFFETGAGS